MPANVIEWDAHHREAAENSFAEPASIFLEWLPLLPTGPALDLACGTGRHALLLAARGQSVTAVDWSGTALDILADRARKAKLPVSKVDATALAGSRARGLRLIKADLELIQLPGCSFSLLLCFNYLQRSLFPPMARALHPGGLFSLKLLRLRNSIIRGARANHRIFSVRENCAPRFPNCTCCFIVS